MLKRKRWIAAALATAGALAAGAAQARNDVQWSVTIGTPVYTQPVPVYRPAPVVVTPAPVYVPAPAPGYHGRPHHRGYGERTRWDADGDGIPNRRDRLYNPRWDVDGDGVPNRHDRDRDGDGVPNWHDRRDGWRR